MTVELQDLADELDVELPALEAAWMVLVELHGYDAVFAGEHVTSGGTGLVPYLTDWGAEQIRETITSDPAYGCGSSIDHNTSGADPNVCQRCGAELEESTP